jgi:hypothetical protein
LPGPTYTSCIRSQDYSTARFALVGGLAVAAVFLALNYRAYDGFFQDDSISTLAWAPLIGFKEYAIAFLKPTFDTANFRPTGHLYYTLMARAFGIDFPPYMTPLFVIHLLNGLLVYLLARKLAIGRWHALAGMAFFTLSASAFDAYWKPMYVFDLLCATFSLASILLFAYRRWVMSFIAFWLAYKAKELAVMLPAVLFAYEYWLGERRFLVLIPFFAASLSFGVQGILLNPNKDNEYTFRFTLAALTKTVPFYARRFLFFPYSGLALVALALVRDRRVWFGLAACMLFLFTLLFLPGRLFEAYTYLPLSCAAIAMAAAASHVKPAWVVAALVLWLPWNVRDLRREARATLALDDENAEYFNQLQAWAAKHPGVKTMIYASQPRGYHHWGVEGAWCIVHNTLNLPVYYSTSPEAAKAMAEQPVAISTWEWNGQTGALDVQIHLPSH